jgi:hypothetical protein
MVDKGDVIVEVAGEGSYEHLGPSKNSLKYHAYIQYLLRFLLLAVVSTSLPLSFRNLRFHKEIYPCH